MKVLFAGYHNPHFMSLAEYVERAIVQLGHDLETFDYRSFVLPGRLRDRFRVLDNWDTRRLNRELLDRVAQIQPDLVLVNGGYTILPETVTAMRGLSKSVTVNWIADFPLKFDVYLKAGPHYQYFFASGTDALGMYREAGHTNGHWLPFACDPEIHRPVALGEEERRRYACDICLIGSNYTERVELLEKLTAFDLAIWGIGWNRLRPDSPLRRCVRGGMVRPEEWIKIYSASKIVLNIIGDQADVPTPRVDKKDFRTTNTKVFEILGCGAFQLVDLKADAETLFEDGKHLVFYRDADELLEKARYYLSHDRARKEIANRGREAVLAKHTYRHRAAEMISVIGLD